MKQMDNTIKDMKKGRISPDSHQCKIDDNYAKSTAQIKEKREENGT